MLDRAAELLASHWKNLSYDGYAVVPAVIESACCAGKYNDHQLVNRLIYSTLKAQQEEEELSILAQEFQFLVFHADRRSSFLAFIKCQLLRPGSECEWCKANPPKVCEALKFEQKLNGLWFDPMPSPDHPGHFKTYLEIEQAKKFDYQQDLFGIGRCSVCVNWWFSSKTEMKRHRRIFHPRLPLDKLLRVSEEDHPLMVVTEKRKRHVCNFEDCGSSFPTYHKLLVHKNATGHKRNRKRQAETDRSHKEIAEKKLNAESQSLLKFFKKRKSVEYQPPRESENVDDDSDEEIDCEAGSNCQIDDCEDDGVHWIQCDICQGWWHLFCLNLVESPAAFTCPKC